MKMCYNGKQIGKLFIIIFLTCQAIFFYSCGKNSKSEEEVNFSQGDIFYEQDSLLKALPYYLDRIELDTLDSIAIFRTAVCLGYLHDYAKSDFFYKRSIEMGYRVKDAYFNLGINAACRLNDSLALEYYNKALMMNPPDSLKIKELINVSKLNIDKHEGV